MQHQSRAITTLIFLGLVEALLESVGIGLFIPLFYSLEQFNLEPEAGDWLGRIMTLMYDFVPASNRSLVLSLIIFGLILIKNIISFGNNVLSSWTNAQIGHYLRHRILDQLLTVGLGFIDRSDSGKLMNTLEGETETATEAVFSLVAILVNLCTIAVFTGLLLLISWQLTILVSCILVIFSAIVRFISHQIERLSQIALKSDEALSRRILEIFKGMRTIRLFANESHEQRIFDNASWRSSKVYFQIDRISGMVDPASEIMAVSLLFVLFFITVNNPQNLPLILAFIFILFRLYPHFSELDNSRNELLAATAGIEQVVELLDHSDKPYIRSGTTAFKNLKDSITLNSVSFRYHLTDSPALNNVSLCIYRSQLTAIVGRSGAGKSTLINLILRIYDPTRGTICVDEVPLQQFDLDSWRQRIAIVDQDVHLFDSSVKLNIAYGRLDATEEEIFSAAKQADAHEFILSLPKGYSTRVGDRGVRLSAGQKQRIALARAIVRDPDILILDEATNALDSMTEHAIQESLRRFAHDRTVIVIAHRLSTIERADNILVLEKGKVIEQGDVQQLLRNGSLFADMHALQNKQNI